MCWSGDNERDVVIAGGSEDDSDTRKDLDSR